MVGKEMGLQLIADRAGRRSRGQVGRGGADRASRSGRQGQNVPDIVGLVAWTGKDERQMALHGLDTQIQRLRRRPSGGIMKVASWVRHRSPQWESGVSRRILSPTRQDIFKQLVVSGVLSL